MKELIMFLTATAGLTMIVVRSGMMRPFRELVSKTDNWARKPRKNKFLLKTMGVLTKFVASVLNCELCFSFWGGLVLYYAIWQDCSSIMIIFGCMSSGFTYLYTKIINNLDGTSCKK